MTGIASGGFLMLTQLNWVYFVGAAKFVKDNGSYSRFFDTAIS